MTRRRTVQSPRRSSRRHNRDWTGTVSTVYTSVPAATKVLFGTFAPSNAGIDETVLRTVGMISVASDQVAADEFSIGAFGMKIVTDLAAAAGAASIPGPVTDISDDGWFVFVPFAESFEFVSAVGIAPNYGRRYPFDSRAKRVLEEGSVVVLMVENASPSFGIEVALAFRMLTMVTGL